MIEFCCYNLASMTIIFMSRGVLYGVCSSYLLSVFIFLSFFWGGGEILLVLRGGLYFFCAFKYPRWSVRPS